MQLQYVVAVLFGVTCTCGLANSSSVTVTVDTSKAPDLYDFGQKCKKSIEAWYSYVADTLLPSPNFTPPKTIAMSFDNVNGVAGTSRDRIVGSINYYREHKDDVGSMLHEMVHVIQSYNKPGCPGWVVEGIADWVRYFKIETNRMPGKPGPGNNYDNGYGVSAYFLNYVNTRVRSDMVYYLNKDCREGTYKDNIWTRLTGKTPKQLWDDMMRSA